jgi:hypothetical protein
MSEHTIDSLTAGQLLDRLSSVSMADLQALLDRIHDSEAIVRAVLRERKLLASRNERWATKERACVC